MATDFELLEGDCLAVGADKRRDLRRPAALTVELILVDVPNRPQLRVKTIETSRSGMQFTSRRAFAVGERIAVKLEFANRGGKLVLCLVRHSTEKSPMVHYVGVEFVDAVSAAPGRTVVPLRWSRKNAAEES